MPLEPRDETVSLTLRLALSLEDFVLFTLPAWPWLPPLTTDAMQPSEKTFHVTSALYQFAAGAPHSQNALRTRVPGHSYFRREEKLHRGMT